MAEMMIDPVDNNMTHLCTVDALELSVRLEHLVIDDRPDLQQTNRYVIVAGHLLACCIVTSS